MTRLDVLVLGVVASVCLALLVSGMLWARTVSRSNQCRSNLRRLGIGLQSYHQAHGMLPPAAFRDGPLSRVDLAYQTSRGMHYSIRVTYANWSVLLLEHVDHSDLAACFDLSSPITAIANQAGRETQLPLMSCPSDAYSHKGNRHILSLMDGQTCEFARGNYAINGGVSDLKFAPGKPWAPAPNGMHRDYTGDLGSPTERVWGNGVAGYNRSFSVAEFQNGLSHVVAIEEVRSGMIPEDSRGAWALGIAGASITSGHGLAGDDRGPNCRHPRSDDVVGCNQAHEAFSCDGLVNLGMPCCPYATPAQATARSMHPGGVNLLMMDGSSRFVTDDIDLSLWHAMHSRETQEPVDLPDHGARTLDRQGTLFDGAGQQSSATTADEIQQETVVNSMGMLLIHVAAGKFTMGLPDVGCKMDDPVTGLPPDVPPHSVSLKEDFFIGAHEVTQQQYMDLIGKNPSYHSPYGDGRIEVVGKDTLKYPVEQVSWDDATEFCRRLSMLSDEVATGRRYRLPTEAEWEYCCRAGSQEPFRVPDEGEARKTGYNVWPDSTEGLPVSQVGAYPQNEFGLFDMRGNVFEWCSDWFAWDYYSRSPSEDPQGPASGTLKVVRGADWRFTAMGCHYPRFHTEPWRTNPYIGFRVVCEIKAE